MTVLIILLADKLCWMLVSLEHEYISQNTISREKYNCFIFPEVKSWQLAYTLQEWPQLQGMGRQNTEG
jgi:hypothetical protein